MKNKTQINYSKSKEELIKGKIGEFKGEYVSIETHGQHLTHWGREKRSGILDNNEFNGSLHILSFLMKSNVEKWSNESGSFQSLELMDHTEREELSINPFQFNWVKIECGDKILQIDY